MNPPELSVQGPVHCVDCGYRGWKLYWTSGSYHLKEVGHLTEGYAPHTAELVCRPSADERQVEIPRFQHHDVSNATCAVDVVTGPKVHCLD